MDPFKMTADVFQMQLGSDNVVVAQRLGISSLEYVMQYHAKVSIPALLVIAATHFFWQKYMDKRQGTVSVPYEVPHNETDIKKILPPSWYAFFPIIPIILLLIFNLLLLNPNTSTYY